MSGKIGLGQRLAIIGLIGAMGGCEMIKNIRIQSDDELNPNPGHFVDAVPGTPRSGRIEMEFRLWPQPKQH